MSALDGVDSELGAEVAAPAVFDAARLVAARDLYLDCERKFATQVKALDRASATLPQFLIIGAPRSGTTFLFALLAETGLIFLPPEKELKFFTGNLAKWDLVAYLQQFEAGRGLVCGEASPSYAVLPRGRIELIRLLNPGMKVIYMLREPAARAASEWKHSRRVETAWSPEEVVSFVASDSILMQSDYGANLVRWLEVFPPEQVSVIFYESLARDPAPVFRRALEFLGVPPVELAPSSFMLPHNATWADPDLQGTISRVAPYVYGARTQRLRRLLSERYPALECPSWVEESRPPDQPSLVFVGEPDPSRSLAVCASGDFLCGPKSALQSLATRGEPTLAAISELRLGFGRLGSEAIIHAQMLDGIVDWKRYAVSSGDRWNGDHFLVRESYFGWHILSFRGMFYTVRDRAGLVDLRRADSRQMLRLQLEHGLAQFEMLEAAMRHAASNWSAESLPAPPESGTERIGSLRAAIDWLRRLPCRAVRGLVYRAVWMMRAALDPETLRRTLNAIARWCQG